MSQLGTTTSVQESVSDLTTLITKSYKADFSEKRGTGSSGECQNAAHNI